MAEILIGPLVSLVFYLGTWTFNKARTRKQNKEDDHETRYLVAAVNNLALFAQSRATAISYLHGTALWCPLGLSSLSMLT
jgi:hypothetical protein